MIPLPSYRPVVEASASYISDTSLDLAALMSRAHHPGSGAVVLFSGEVREGDESKKVSFLDYDAHVSMAAKMIGDILEDAKAHWALNIAIAQHRIGRVEVGEIAVVVITSAAHRQEAYAANRYIIDKIKHEVPIWKCEYFEDGTKTWGGSCNCNTTEI